MDNFRKNFLAGLRQLATGVVGKAILALAVIVALVSGVKYFRSSTASAQGTATAMPAALATETMPTTGHTMPGMEVTPTPMPGMPGMGVMTTPAPTNMQPGGGSMLTDSDADALLLQMQQMMASLQGVMTQLETSAISATLATPTPTATPALDAQAIAMELKNINDIMGPLMVRIQADLQTTPSAEELASVRTQVQAISLRITNLINQIQVARGYATSPVVTIPSMPDMAVAPTTMPPMPGMGNAATPVPNMGHGQSPSQDVTAQLAEMLTQMQEMLLQMQTQQTQSGLMPGMAPTATPHAMAGMPASGASTDTVLMDNMTVMLDTMMTMLSNMKAMSAPATPTAMPSMPGSDPATNALLAKMQELMAMMTSMNAMSGMGATPTPGMNMPGMNMPGMAATATPMPGMSGSDPAMQNMMMMMDDMMMMMDDMMMMPGMSGSDPAMQNMMMMMDNMMMMMDDMMMMMDGGMMDMDMMMPDM